MLEVVKTLRTNVIISGPNTGKIIKLLNDTFGITKEPLTEDIPLLYEDTSYFKKRKKNLTGNILKGARYREDITQEELADLTGIFQGRISEYESGKRKIKNVEIAKKLAKYLKIDYKYLL